MRTARVAKREIEHRQGHSSRGPHQGFGRDPIVQLDRRSKPACRVGVATHDGKVEADDREVLVEGAFTRLEGPVCASSAIRSARSHEPASNSTAASDTRSRGRLVQSPADRALWISRSSR